MAVKNNSPKLNLTNLPICNQVWEEMTPCEGGRLCAGCQKVIIDFREMTDREVTETHLFSDQPVCGVYRPDQLRMEQLLRWRVSKVWRNWYLGVITFLSFKSLEAKIIQNGDPMEQVEPSYADTISIPQTASKIDTAVQEKVVIHGKVTDGNNEPLIGAAIGIESSQTYALTDLSGYYELDITEVLKDTDNLVLDVKYVGFTDVTYQYTQGNPRNIDLQLEESGMIIDFVVVAPPYKPTLWWRIKNLFRKKR
ncbi:MAG: carboxypeptidase-like regulatory domain-containing protein [Bacteroidota bacterium]